MVLKKIKKKFYTLTVVVIMTNLPISCCWNSPDSCCGESFSGPDELRVTGIQAEIGSYRMGAFSNEASQSYDTAAIKVYISDLEVFSERWRPSKPSHFSAVNPAMACSPPLPAPGHFISSIQISSNLAVKANGNCYEVGSLLNELFRVTNHGGRTLREFIELSNSSFVFYESRDFIVLQLRNPPDEVIGQKLSLVFRYDNGDIITLESEPFDVAV